MNSMRPTKIAALLMLGSFVVAPLAAAEAVAEQRTPNLSINQDAELRNSIRQRSQDRSLRQRLGDERAMRRGRRAAERAAEEQRRAQERSRR